ncbi:hypothetical protein [Acinetobacter brisouii]|uniref:hypothetical protein n=1 Tax=Acinetobacter brisouii TaxID=396323 RepID=UPI00124C155F|nr:hypothetical protein [Acinetobacter brisouii]
MIYFDKDGKSRINEQEWLQKRQDKDYCEILRFQDNKVRIVIEWLGQADDQVLFPASYPIFKAIQHDKLSSGAWVEAPESQKSFAKLKDAEDHYNHHVLAWTKSYTNNDGALVEVGNELAPPDPAKTEGKYGDEESSDCLSGWSW